MAKSKSIITLLVLIFVFIFAVYMIMLNTHEITHKTIYGYAGVDSEIHLNPFGQSYTEPTNFTGQDLTNLELAHANAEAFGYQLIPAVLIISFLLLLIIFSLMMILFAIEEKG